MNDQILTTLTTAGSLALGWTLNELSGYFKSGRERRQVLNKILFHQLSIRDIIFKTDVEAMEKAIGDIITKKLNPEQKENVRELFSAIFSGFIHHELNRRFSSDIKRIMAGYKSAIAELSRIDPYVTYKISDKDVVLDYLSYLDDYFNFVEDHLEADKKDKGDMLSLKRPIAVIRQKVTPFIRESALETIELDIRLIAKAKGYISLFKSIRFLNKRREFKLDQGAVAKVERYLTSISASPD